MPRVSQTSTDAPPATQDRRLFEADARRQSLGAAALACDPDSDEHAVIREIEAEFADDEFWAEE